MKLTKTVVSGSVLALAFLANCDFVFGPSWTYGEEEMRAAVEGTWKMTSEGQTITLVAKQATAAKQSERERGFVNTAAACGSRSFVRQAAACSDSTRMPLEITAAGHTIEEAELAVHSTTFTGGFFRFHIDGASVDAEVDPIGKVSRVYMYRKDQPVTVALERVTR